LLLGWTFGCMFPSFWMRLFIRVNH
jgi:hypothetical protein